MPRVSATIDTFLKSPTASGAVQAALAAATDEQAADMRTCLGVFIDAKAYGAVGDAKQRTNAAMTGGSAILTSATGSFVAGDVGKYIRVEGAGAAGADLIATISARASATSITLSAPAGTTVSGANIYYGTNDSAAIQAACDAAAASADTRTLYFPPGAYICNFEVYSEMVILGAGAGANWSSFAASDVSSRSGFPTLMVPATRDEPVIKADQCLGTEFRRFGIWGSNSRQGTGIEIADPATAASGFGGGIITFEHVFVAGFDRCFSASRCAEIRFINCQAYNFQSVGWYMADEDTGSPGFTDGITWDSCGAVSAQGVAIYSNGGKNLNVINGDYNYMANFADLTNSRMNVGAANLEYLTAQAFVLRGACSLVINTITVAAPAAPLIANLGTSDDIAVHTCSASSPTGSASYQGRFIAYQSIRRTPPRILPSGMAKALYADTTWASRTEVELTELIYQTAESRAFDSTLTDSFSSRVSASPYCDMGWVLTNIGGGTPAVRNNTGAGFTFGRAEVHHPGSTIANALRFALPNAITYFPTYFEIRMVLDVYVPSKTILRAGVYDIAGTAIMTPTNGVGIRADTSVPETNIFLEVISGGVVTSLDTGVAISQLSAAREIVIQRTPLGISCVIRSMPYSGAGKPLAPQVLMTSIGTAPAGYLAPCFLLGVSSAEYTSLGLQEYSFRDIHIFRQN